MAGPNDLFRKYPTEAGAGEEHPSGIQLQYPTDVVRLILENAQDAIYISQDRYLTFINAKAAQITGYTLEELMSRPAIDFVHPDDREAITDRYNRRFRGEEVPDHYPHRLVCKNGNVVCIEANHVMITWQGRPAALTFVRDITSLKKAEEELKARMESIEEMNTTLKVLLRQRNGRHPGLGRATASQCERIGDASRGQAERGPTRTGPGRSCPQDRVRLRRLLLPFLQTSLQNTPISRPGRFRWRI